MFNFGWAELMVIGVVALIVIGPDDLPDMFRQLGRFTAKLRSMSRDFSRAMDQAAKESGVKDVAKDLKGMTSTKAMGLDAVKSAADKFEKWDPVKHAAKPMSPMVNSTLSGAKPLVPPPMPATPAAAMPVPATTVPATTVPDTTALDDLTEADDDLADHAEHGPATQALYDKQAARAAVIAEQTAKLKAIEDGTYVADTSAQPPLVEKAAPKRRVAKPKVAATEPKPQIPHKSKKADLA